jgi:hypothetical protein
MLRLGCGLAIAVLLATAAPRLALACACCSNPGQRTVETVALDANKRKTLKALRFTGKAELYMDESDGGGYSGIDSELSQYSLKTEWQGNRLVFALNDGHGYSGTLALELPAKMSLFEVDPRNTKDTGAGPLLYMEWKVTGKVSGSGKFAASAGPKQLLTLIAQGSGISCTTAADFTHWSLVMQGPKANYMFFGELIPVKEE